MVFWPLNVSISVTNEARANLKIASESLFNCLSNALSPMSLTAVITEIIRASDFSLKTSCNYRDYYYYYSYYFYSAGFCLDPTGLTSHGIDLKLWILIGLGLNWCISPVRPCRVIRSRAITHFVNLVMFQISKTIRPIWTRLDSLESLFNFQKLYKNNFFSQINTKPATPTFIKNGPNFTLFAAHFCSSPANPPGRPTGLKIGTDAGLDLNWCPEKSRSSRSSRSWDTVAQMLSCCSNIVKKFQNQISDPILTCLRSPEPDVR